MSEPETPIRAYAVGDVIRLRVTVTHEDNIEAIQIVYGLEGGDHHTITFEGDVDSTVAIELDEQGNRLIPQKTMTATLLMAVDVDHKPGVYRPITAAFRSGAVGSTFVNLDEGAPSPFRPPPFLIWSKDLDPSPPIPRIELLDEDDE